MTSVLISLLVALVFVVAGLAKIASPSATAQNLVGFGVPKEVAKPAGLALGCTECVLGVLLPWPGFAAWPALGAMTLIAVLSAGVGYQLARGRTPACHCFGQVHERPISPWTLVRNLALLAATLCIALSPPRRDFTFQTAFSDLSASSALAIVLALVLTAAIAAQSSIIVHLVRQQGRMLQRLDALERVHGVPRAASSNSQFRQRGEPAPTFALPDATGLPVGLEGLCRSGLPLLLVFLEPGCGPCTRLLPRLAEHARDLHGRLQLAVISSVRFYAASAASILPPTVHVLADTTRATMKAYGVTGTPTAVLIEANGTMSGTVLVGSENISHYLRERSASQRPLANAA